MFWLVSQIWFWILLGALAGGIIGWALRCRKCEHDTAGLKASLERAYSNNYLEPDDRRVSGGVGFGADDPIELSRQLAAQKEEVAGLKAKLALNGATGNAPSDAGFAGLSVFSGSHEVNADDGQLTWRNRYLESRVRFLETKIEEFELTPKKQAVASSLVDVKFEASHGGYSSEEKALEQSSTSFATDQNVTLSASHGLGESRLTATDSVVAQQNTDLEPIAVPKGNESDAVRLSKSAEDSFELDSNDNGEAHTLDEQTLAWRNRYLEGRVRYLEEERKRFDLGLTSEIVDTEQVENLEITSETLVTESGGNESTKDSSETHDLQIQQQDNSDEVDRLRWRTRYLEGRIRFLEEEAAVTALKIEKESIHPKLPVATPLDASPQINAERANWRNAYLEERLKYVPSSVKVKNAPPELSVVEADTPNMRSEWREAYLAERINYGKIQLEIERNKVSVSAPRNDSLEIDRLQWRSKYLEERLLGVKEAPTLPAQTSLQVTDLDDRESLPEFNESIALNEVEKDESLLQPSEEDTFAAEYLAEVENEVTRLKWREAYYASLAARARDNLEAAELNAEVETEIEKSENNTEKQNEPSFSDVEYKRLEWRNRYLHGRLKYLEENVSASAHRIASLEKAAEKTSSDALVEDASLYGDESDTARLKWRNSYLLGRIGYLEEESTEGKRSFVKSVNEESKVGDALDNLDDLSKLKYESPDSDFVPSASVAFENARLKAQEEREKSKGASTSRKKQNTKKVDRQSRSREVNSSDQFQETFLKSEYFVSGDSETGRPAYLTQPLFGKHDELREIAGVGPKIERILHDLGIYHFYQIASWTRKEVEWVDNYLTFKGRIDRENWIEQCKKLARGEETDGQRKYRDGKHT
ncbi:hypothetical protein [Hirschia litorea]|uniref:NADH dehydrogenase subunit E n=1 Tax=Hirschia litorea TaxID=1199156 RepID=A0ABW2II19_9PROT